MHLHYGTGFQHWQGWMKMMFKQQRLHPATIFFNFTRILRESIFAIVLGFITFRDESFVYFILILGAILVIFIIISALSWYRFTYQVEDDDLRIEYGIIIRKKRYISKNRIQSIDLSAGVVHRLFKLVKVQIETAGSGSGAEASLKAVKLWEGERLRNELKKVNKQQIESDVETPKQPSYTISFKQLFLAGSTSGSVGIILAFFFFAFSQMEQFIPERFYENTLEWVIGLSIALIIGLGIILLIVLWLFGIAGTMIKYGNFKITKHNDELFITRGLLEKKQLTLPLRRIQAIGLQESLIRQPLGYVTIFAEVAGGSVEKGEDISTVLFPIMNKGEVRDFLEKLLPEYAGAAQPEELVGPPKRALKFYLFRSMILFIILGAGVVYFFPQFSWIPVLFIIASLFLGSLRYRDSGYHIQDKALMVRYRIFSKTTMIMYHKRIQSFERKQHTIHRKQDLATAVLSIIGKYGAGKHYRLKELDEADANRLSSWFSYRKP